MKLLRWPGKNGGGISGSILCMKIHQRCTKIDIYVHNRHWKYFQKIQQEEAKFQIIWGRNGKIKGWYFLEEFIDITKSAQKKINNTDQDDRALMEMVMIKTELPKFQESIGNRQLRIKYQIAERVERIMKKRRRKMRDGNEYIRKTEYSAEHAHDRPRERNGGESRQKTQEIVLP